jgi:hypothetical protein
MPQVYRTLPDAELDAFVARLARRVASFPAGVVRSAKRLLNELTMRPPRNPVTDLRVARVAGLGLPG